MENGRAGIHRLPREAFVFIVNLAASFSDWGDQEAYAATASPESGLPKLSRFQILGKLRVVGSRWARAIDASPVLWTVFDRQDHAERALALSRNFSISTSEAGVELEDLTVAKKLFECTERWRRISLTMPQTIFPFLRRLHKKKAPRLECLRITLQESDVDAAMVNPFAGDIPNLKILQLQGVALPMAPLPPYFLGLQELRVSEPFIETQALYNLIKDSTELAILEVASTRDSSAAWSPPAIARSESLRLVELHGDLAFRILPYLQTPRCLSMKADIRLDEGLALDARARDTIKHFTRHVISENLDLKVVWEVVGCGHWIDEQTVKLSGSFKHPASYTLAIVVGSAFHRGADWMQLVMDCLSDLSRPVEMALTFDWAGARWDDDCVDSRLLSTLIRLPATTLTFHHKIPHQLLDPLCNPIDDHPAGEASWTFPALEVIHLCREVSTRGMDKMEMLLAERYRHGGPKMLLKEVRLPYWAARCTTFSDFILPAIRLYSHDSPLHSCLCNAVRDM